jgi:hypothetical protein
MAIFVREHDHAIPHECDDEVLAMVADHVGPAASGLEQAAVERDADAVRAFAYELIVLAGSAIGATRRD